MNQGFTGDTLIEWLLGWFRSLAGGIFDSVTGSSGNSLFKWLDSSWKGILIVLFVFGCGINLVIYVIRWRPHWWWFAKKRMIVDDSIFEPHIKTSKSASQTPKRPSTIVPKRAVSSPSKDLFEPDNDDFFKAKKRSRK